MTSTELLPAAVLTRKAVVDIRQSTEAQVQSNLESQRRQYELVMSRGNVAFARSKHSTAPTSPAQSPATNRSKPGRATKPLAERPRSSSMTSMGPASRAIRPPIQNKSISY